MKKELNKDTFCPWMYKAVSLEGNMIRPCCRFTEDIIVSDKTLVNEYTNGKMDIYRKKLKNGEKISSCNQCWHQENIGHKSLRQQGIDRWGLDDTPEIEFLEFSIDNTCNLRCLFCASTLSTAWIKEEKKIFGKSINNEIKINESIYSDLDLSKIKIVKFVGGEPLMSSAITNISKKLLNKEYLEVKLNTNVTKLPNETIDQLFLNCTYLEIDLSIDGIQILNNFIRYDTEWKIIENNFEYFDALIDRRKENSTKITVATTVNAYNINMLHTIKEYFQKNFPRFSTYQSILRKPEFMAIQNLPADYKEKVLPYLEEHNFQEEISFLKIKERNLFNYFVNFHNKILEIRNIDFSEINPLLNDYIKNFKKQDADFEKIFLMKSGFSIDDV